MSDVRARYPDLDDFLSSEFIQDPNDDRSMREVVDDFWQTRGRASTAAVAMDIRRFLRDRHNDIESAFNDFIPQIYPPAMGLTTAAWLSVIADLIERTAEQH